MKEKKELRAKGKSEPVGAGVVGPWRRRWLR